MVNGRNSPFPVDGVTSAMYEAVNSPITCSYRNLRTPEVDRKRTYVQAESFQLQVWFLKQLQNLYLQAAIKGI